MKRSKILHQILKRTRAYQIIGAFLAFAFIAALIIMLTEPGINRYGDALWYCYANLFTIGFGDFVPVTACGRIISVILTVYATVVIALVTGVIVSFYTSITKKNYDDAREVILDKLSRLPELSKEELTEISDKVKKFK